VLAVSDGFSSTFVPAISAASASGSGAAEPVLASSVSSFCQFSAVRWRARPSSVHDYRPDPTAATGAAGAAS